MHEALHLLENLAKKMFSKDGWKRVRFVARNLDQVWNLEISSGIENAYSGHDRSRSIVEKETYFLQIL